MMAKANRNEEIISQAEIDNLFRINEFIETDDKSSLIEELKQAILNSGKLELAQWQSLRGQLGEIEALIPHIDLIIKLKKEAQ
ncbi:hypothetical protein L3081_05245 [Colwellia sp. MSW7]|jgi:hypothetical protein|uniref:Uncharacterized protein n=1 Tax=Colwellia maritima TaxID=2912588 RepID=A0ABS9WY92_9GAMM|nr:hypothetical protein [Colwellia maritima]MCI2282901.1 hypothetical protein [Colwellia maritima]